MDVAATRSALADLTGLLGEINDLKRVRSTGGPRSIAAAMFERAWAALAAGRPVEEVALATTASAVAAARLGGIDRAVLERSGLCAGRVRTVLERSFDAMAGPLEEDLRGALRAHLCPARPGATPPAFVAALAEQPRAGPTSPGKPRIVLEPPESHAEHCLMVAVYAVLVAPTFDADPADAFLLGLMHHLHNAVLPDAGFAGEELLGDELAGIMERLTKAEIATLAPPLAAEVERVRPLLATAEHPVSRAFHTADVIDRVLQVRQYARAAAFTVDQALDDLELVHAGPVQAFQLNVLREAGLP